MFSTFSGGIHPPQNKSLTSAVRFTNLSIPHKCYIPLQQHTGAPAIPVVKVGDLVVEGQLIGKGEGFISANVHASIPGKVVDILKVPTIYQEQPTVVIEAEGAFSSPSPSRGGVNWHDLPADEIRNRIREAGIVGLGGAAFPTAVKLSPPQGKKIDTLVVNGAECEPYLTVDDMCMQSYPDELIEGIRITLKALGLERGVIGIERNKPASIKALHKAVRDNKPAENITVRSLRTKYPQGAEKQLIYSLLKRKVPSRGLPMDVGVVVQNVGTILAIREAVLFNKPLFERYITVSGSLINKPGNYKVRIGTRISDIVTECGGLKDAPAKVIVGGPLCGTSIHTMDVPVVKGTSGILFLSEKEIAGGDYSPCIRCGRCIAICPAGLVPSELGTAVEFERYDRVQELHPYDCIMCGSCAYVCPARRPLNHFIKLAQIKLKS